MLQEIEAKLQAEVEARKAAIGDDNAADDADHDGCHEGFLEKIVFRQGVDEIDDRHDETSTFCRKASGLP